MTYISRKTRLLVPHFVDECDPGYFYHLTAKRSDGRLKKHASCCDLRAWADDEYLNYQYFLDLMSDGEERPFSGLMGRFIPIEAILRVLAGKNLEGGDSFAEWENGGRIAALGPRPDLNDSGVNEITDDLLKLADAAMAKLETIRGILSPESCEGLRGQSNGSSQKQNKTGSRVCACTHLSRSVSNNTDTEKYSDYNNALTKIACLRQKLHSIQQRRDELDAKIQLSCQKKCHSSSRMTVTELYNREHQSNKKRLQKKIQKLIAEKGQVLQDMCSSLEYINELKKSIDAGNEPKKCTCARSKVERCSSSERLTPQQREKFSSGILREKRGSNWKTSNSDESFQDGKRDYRERKLKCQKCAQFPTKEAVLESKDSSRGSSEATFISLETLPLCDSQRTYNVGKESIPDRKFKSETTMTEVEQTVRSYEQRLSDLACLENKIEELKREAAMAEYFKKRWLRSMMRSRNEKIHGEEVKRKLEEFQNENCELKKMIQTLANESEKEHNEMQRLRSKAAKIVRMQEEMTKLNDQINCYQLSCMNQNEDIGRLKITIQEQRDEIERLRTHMTRLCRITEKLREGKRPNKTNVPRSRSYGPESPNSALGHQRSALIEPVEEVQRTSCGACCRRYHTPEQLNRPRSECGRRMPDRCPESLPHQQINGLAQHRNL